MDRERANGNSKRKIQIAEAYSRLRHTPHLFFFLIYLGRCDALIPHSIFTFRLSFISHFAALFALYKCEYCELHRIQRQWYSPRYERNGMVLGYWCIAYSSVYMQTASHRLNILNLIITWRNRNENHKIICMKFKWNLDSMQKQIVIQPQPQAHTHTRASALKTKSLHCSLVVGGSTHISTVTALALCYKPIKLLPSFIVRILFLFLFICWAHSLPSTAIFGIDFLPASRCRAIFRFSLLCQRLKQYDCDTERHDV